jgi:hypothetical protein
MKLLEDNKFFRPEALDAIEQELSLEPKTKFKSKKR